MDRFIIGAVHKTKEGYNLRIIKILPSKTLVVVFDNGVELYCSKEALLKGNLKNPYHPSVCDVGYMGVGIYKSKNLFEREKSYEVWKGMLKRCYDEKIRYKNPTYKNVTACEEWHCYQSFAKWYEENQPKIKGVKFHLDKDLLQRGIKTRFILQTLVYSCLIMLIVFYLINR